MLKKNISVWSICGGLVVVFSSLALPVFAQKEGTRDLRKGNEAYKSNEFKEAEDLYRKGTSEKTNEIGTFNLGNSLYRQERFDESVESYKESIAGLQSKEKSNAYYNLGNAYFKSEKLKEAIDAYKSAITLDEENYEARENLFKAKKILTQQQNEQKQQDKDKDKKKDDNQKQGQNQDQQDQEQQQNQEQQQEQQQNQPQKDLTKEEALRLLQAVDKEDNSIQEKIKKSSSRPAPGNKNW